jgi:hypothetical protein
MTKKSILRTRINIPASQARREAERIIKERAAFGKGKSAR